MAKQQGRPADDPSSAPESGTVRDETSGNNPAGAGERPPQAGSGAREDDPSVAGEER